MAKTRQPYRHRQYRTYGSVAYQPEYDGSAVRTAQPLPQPKPQVRPRRKVVRRPQIRVRQAGSFSPFAVLGFAVVAVCAALLLIANAQLMMVNDQTVSLRAELRTLQEEAATLSAQQELSVDLDALERELVSSGRMVKPQASQIAYLSAVEPDSVVRFQPSRQSLGGLLAQLWGLFSGGLS